MTIKQHPVQENLERSVSLSCSLQDLLVSQTEACHADYKKDSKISRAYIQEQNCYHNRLSMSHAASKITALISGLLPWGTFGTRRVSTTGMFGLACSAASVFWGIQSKRCISQPTSNWQSKTARILELASSCLYLKAFLGGPVGLAAQAFGAGLAIGQAAISIFGERCQKKITKLELNHDTIRLKQEQRGASFKLLAKTFSASMNSDGSALGLIRQMSMMQENALDEILKRQ
ncbi:hypothetical protein HAT2_00409 [Candidatus Similichlamydia laticola]|uniref:Uncharacterized protein n=2 Tax=Candidatus Similichlamydia laticola TaxID=2170265 RepID=A0A369KI64_9BACT|nr:hypothetical protein HAT2_00409 [Candidatus Similichlamydia laticola]